MFSDTSIKTGFIFCVLLLTECLKLLIMDFVDNDYAIHTMDTVSTKLQTKSCMIFFKKWGKHSLICFMTNNYM